MDWIRCGEDDVQVAGVLDHDVSDGGSVHALAMGRGGHDVAVLVWGPLSSG